MEKVYKTGTEKEATVFCYLPVGYVINRIGSNNPEDLHEKITLTPTIHPADKISGRDRHKGKRK
jgi:hypothetical protein